MGESRDTQSGIQRGRTEEPLDCINHVNGSPSFVNFPPQSLFPHRLTPSEVVSLWRLLATCSSSTLTATPQAATAPEQPQPQQQQQQQQHVEVAEEASPTGAANKSQSKPSTAQPGNKVSEKDKKHRKSQKEPKAAQSPPKKNPSSSGRPAVSAASPGVSTPQAGAASSVSEALASGSESRLGAPTSHGATPSADRGDPAEAIRVALGVPPCGMGGEAAVGLVLRALLFCKDYLLQPEVTSCVISFLGVQLQWLCCWGLCAARRLPSACKQEAREQTEPGLSPRQTGASTFEGVTRSGCLSSRMEVGTRQQAYEANCFAVNADTRLKAVALYALTVKHLTFLSRRLTKETERLLAHLRGCDLLKQQQNGETLSNADAAEEFDPSLKGSISATEAEMLHSFLLNGLINHGYFFAVVLASSLAPGEKQAGNVAPAAAPAAAPLTC
ncbi:hypothetical protein Emed_006523 [Eimeria media]